jgi:hypothetical protein
MRDGAGTILASGFTIANGTAGIPMTHTAMPTPTTTTTYKLSAYDANNGGSTIKAAALYGGTGNTASTILAVRVG